MRYGFVRLVVSPRVKQELADLARIKNQTLADIIRFALKSTFNIEEEDLSSKNRLGVDGRFKARSNISTQSEIIDNTA